MKRRLNVLRVVIGLNQGGVQQGVLNLFRGLDGERFNPIACAIENSGAIGGDIEKAGFEVITLGYRSRFWKTVGALVEVMRDRSIDIVHASSYHPSLYARIAGIRARVPVLISHEHSVYGRKRWHRVGLNRILEPFTQGYVAVSQGVFDHVTDWYHYPPDKIHLIHNGVDVDRFRPKRSRPAAKRQLGLDPDRPVVGMISGLEQPKGHAVFFEAIKKMHHRRSVQWLVVGTGRDERAIQHRAEELGLTDVVHFLGLRRDVPELLNAFDIYVLPTFKEGFANSILEAMAAGCGVVVSDFPSNLEMVQPGINGLITPMGDVARLAEALDLLLTDGERCRQLGTAARDTVENHFSVGRFAEKIMMLYDGCWQHHQNRAVS